MSALDELEKAGTLELPEGMRLVLVDANLHALAVYGTEGARKMWPGRDMTRPDWRVELVWDLPGGPRGSETAPSWPAAALLARTAMERGAKMYGQA